MDPDRRESDAEISTELVRRIQEGDDSAWPELYRRYRDPLLLSIRCRLGPKLRSHLQSEDILHSVVKDALVDLRKFEPRGANSLDHYLHVCVLNKIRVKAEYYSAKKRSGEVPLRETLHGELPDSGAGEPRYLDAERYERLERALERLPEPMREVVLLRRIENLSNLEVAEVLGKNPDATSKTYNRAIARLGMLMREPESP